MLKLGLLTTIVIFLFPINFAFAQKTTAKVGGEFKTESQEILDMAICLKAGLRCKGSEEYIDEGCYIESQPCEEILVEEQKENK